MSVIEKVARAICKAQRIDPDEEEFGIFEWQYFDATARSAIQALIVSEWPALDPDQQVSIMDAKTVLAQILGGAK